jgi:hypothetical protein
MKSTSIAQFVSPILFVALLLLTPLFIHAQINPSADSAQLRATIRSAILQDPRSASIPSAQLDVMVDALVTRAQGQGITSQSLAYVPGAIPRQPLASNDALPCDGISPALCPLAYAMGYNNPDKSVPIGLWITSGILIWVISRMRKHPTTVPLKIKQRSHILRSLDRVL